MPVFAWTSDQFYGRTGIQFQSGVLFPLPTPLGLVTKARKPVKFGKVIYADDPTAYLAVPLRILFQQHGSKVMVIYRKPPVVLGGYNGLNDLGQQLDGVFSTIAKEATN